MRRLVLSAFLVLGLLSCSLLNQNEIDYVTISFGVPLNHVTDGTNDKATVKVYFHPEVIDIILEEEKEIRIDSETRGLVSTQGDKLIDVTIHDVAPGEYKSITAKVFWPGDNTPKSSGKIDKVTIKPGVNNPLDILMENGK